jgi:hypothetical protein
MKTPVSAFLALLFVMVCSLAASSSMIAAHIKGSIGDSAVEFTSSVPTKIIAVRMYADWCGNCRALDPKVDAIKGGFHNRGVLFTRFDQTDEFAVAQSELLAARTNLTAAFEAWKGKTGVMLLVDANSGEILEVINHRMTPEEIAAAIEARL